MHVALFPGHSEKACLSQRVSEREKELRELKGKESTLIILWLVDLAKSEVNTWISQLHESISSPFSLRLIWVGFLSEPNETWLIHGFISNFTFFWIFSLNVWCKTVAYSECYDHTQMGHLSWRFMERIQQRILVLTEDKGFHLWIPRALCLLDAQKIFVGVADSEFLQSVNPYNQ